MTFKEKAVAALREVHENEYGPCRTVIRECMELVANIPEEDEKCASPDYRVMCAELEKKLTGTAEELKKAAMELACAEEEIRNLRGDNQWLTGFREAVLRIFPEGDCCYGRR